MPKTPPRGLYVPLPELTDFVAILKELFAQLFESAHDHLPRTAVPGDNEGRPGDIVPVETDEGVLKLYVKLPSAGWTSVTLS